MADPKRPTVEEMEAHLAQCPVNTSLGAHADRSCAYLRAALDLLAEAQTEVDHAQQSHAAVCRVLGDECRELQAKLATAEAQVRELALAAAETRALLSHREAELEGKLAEAESRIVDLVTDNQELAAKLTEAQRDTERLDFVVTLAGFQQLLFKHFPKLQIGHPPTPRAAIDAAREKP